MSDPRLLLRDDAHWIATDDELHILSHRGFRSLPLSGAQAWLDRLLPHLDGQHSTHDLVASLTGEQREFVIRLLGVLVDSGLLRELDAREPTVAARPEITLLGQHSPSPSAAYARWVERRTLVVGNGPAADAIALACRRAGNPRTARTEGLGDDEVDHVVHVLDIDRLEDLLATERACHARGIALTQVVMDGSAAWIVDPFTSWQEVRPRLIRSDDVQPTTDPARAWPTVLAAQVAQATMTSCVPAPRAASATLRRFDALTLGTTVHRVLPAPAVSHVSGVPLEHRVATLLDAPAIGDDELSVAAHGLSDDRTGVFAGVAEADLAQVPLRMAQTWVTIPAVGAAAGREPRRTIVRAAGIDPVTARLRAAAEAICVYSDALSGLLRSPDDDVEGFDLARGRAVSIPADLLDRSSAAKTGRTCATVATGRNLDQAIVAGLLDLCRDHTIGGFTGRSRPAVRLDPRACTDPRARHCLAALSSMATVELHDVTGPLGVPTVGVLLDGLTVAHGSGTDLTGAMAEALMAAATARQLDRDDHQARPTGRFPTLPATAAREGTAAACLTRNDLVGALRREGLTPVCLLLDHDPAVFAVLPVVRVIALAEEDSDAIVA